ncbi:MAG: 2-dehydropantoate 2-reductase [Wenzhouxiangellaceae bacterium]
MVKIMIFGSGAVGAYFGARLLAAGRDVTLIARGHQLQAMREHGLHIESIDGDLTLPKVPVTDDVTGVGHIDLVLVAVKAWQLDQAIAQLRPAIQSHTVILPLLNGIEVAPLLVNAFSAEQVMGGLCKIVSKIEAPGKIQHFGAKPTIVFGELNQTLSDRALQIQQQLAVPGIKAQAVADIQLEMWEKFLFITSLSGMGALTDVAVGALRADDEMRDLITRVMHEIVAVAQACGVEFNDNIIDQTWRFFDLLPTQTTTSMQRDIRHQKPSELEAQCGAVIRLARQHGVATPLNEMIYHCLRVRQIPHQSG